MAINRPTDALRLVWSQKTSALGLKLPLDGGGGGPHPPDMEARVAKLEANLDHVQQDVKDLRADFRDLRGAVDRDFRLTWGMMIAGFLGLAGLLAKGFHWLP